MDKAGSMSRLQSDSGFSLVEALVALAVFAMAGVALVGLQTQSLHSFSRVETRALADLAAQNRLTQIIASRAHPAVGVQQEELQFAGRAWRMEIRVVAAPGGEMNRITVAVGAPRAEPSAVVHGFIATPEAGP